MAAYSMRQAAQLAQTHVLVVHRALKSGQLHGEPGDGARDWSIQEECLRAWLAHAPCGHSSRRADEDPQPVHADG